MPAIAWVGIGCGSIILIGIIICVVAGFFIVKKAQQLARHPEKATAEAIVALNPELQKVKDDDEKGEMTIRTKAGEEFTISYKDLKDGKLSYRSSNGQMVTMSGASDLNDVPAWVPRVPHAIGPASVFRGIDNGKETGFYTVETEESTDAMVSYFGSECDKAGLTSSSNSSFSAGNTENVTYTYSDASREVSLVITRNAGKPAFVRVGFRTK